jgi:hypothetical protein
LSNKWEWEWKFEMLRRRAKLVFWREGGEKERGKQGDEVNVVVPAALTSAPAPSLVQIPATRVQMKVSEDVVMPTTAAQALHGKLNCFFKGDVTGLTAAPNARGRSGEEGCFGNAGD